MVKKLYYFNEYALIKITHKSNRKEHIRIRKLLFARDRRGGRMLWSSCRTNHDSQVLRKRLSRVLFFLVTGKRRVQYIHERWISSWRYFCIFPQCRNKDIQEASHFVIFPGTVTDSRFVVTVEIMLIIMTSVKHARLHMKRDLVCNAVEISIKKTKNFSADVGKGKLMLMN